MPTSVTIPPLRRQPSQSPQKIPNKPRVPSVSDPPPLRVCSAGKLRQGVRVDSFLPAYIARKAKLFFPPLLRTTRDNREGREDGEGVEAIKVWGSSQHCHTQDGGAAAARSLRGGTNACAARSPGPGHKMAAAALGRARRRRQNGRSSRTCGRIPSSPFRAAADARSPRGPCLHC